MKNFLIILISLISITHLTSETIYFPENSDETLLSYDSVNLNSIILEFNLAEFDLTETIIDKKTYHKLSLKSDYNRLSANRSLPSISNLIVIPDQGEVSLEILESQTEILAGFNLEISDNKDQEIISISKPHIFRDLRVVNLRIDPFEYNSVTGDLTVYKNLKFEIKTEGSGGINQKTITRKRSRIFDKIYESAILNYTDLDLREDFQQPTYIFIYPENENVELELQNLITWKLQKGFSVNAVSTAETGTSLNQIKAYLQDAYDNWEDPPEYVCLVGDAGGNFNIPCSYYEGGEGDQLYSLLEGDDILADVIVGRISFNDIFELQTIITKILLYEQYPYLDEPAWFTNTLLSADPTSCTSAVINTCLYIKEMISDLNPVYTFDEVYSEPFPPPMNASLNNGACFFVYRGQLGMNNWNPYNHNNGQKFYSAVIITCGTGDYYNGTSTAEEILRLGTPTAPKGGIAAIGTTGPHTHTSFNNIITAGVFDAIFNQGIYSIGGALVYGKLMMIINYPDNQANHVHQFCYWNNLMGDPGVEIYSDLPQQMIVNYEPEIALGTNYYEILVTDQSGNPIENSLVSLYKTDQELQVTDYTNENGQVILPIIDINEGEVNLTVTKYNHIPFLTAFSIAQQEENLSITDYQIDDDNEGSSSGNADGFINPGENIELQVAITNFGSITVENVIVIITSESEYISISDDFEDYGVIFPGQTVYSADDFDFNVFSQAPGNTQIQLDFTILADEMQFNDHLYLNIYGFDLVYTDHQINNGNDQQLEPGETAELTVTIENTGQITAENVYGILTSDSNLLQIDNEITFFGYVNPETEIDNNNQPFIITANTQILPGSQYGLDLLLYNNEGYSKLTSFMIQIGNAENGDPLGPDEYGYWCYDDGDTVYYNFPVYDWIEIDPTYGGQGVGLDLIDYGNQGDIETIDIPFAFVFYGVPYNEITICTNGWICPGITNQESFMNWHLPGPLGPSPMISPFWDDLKTGNGDVFYLYNQDLNYFIVEWSHLQNEYDNSEETFQLILYDPLYYPTSTGDSDIKFQYQTVNNVDLGSYGGALVDHGQFATVGIEDHTGTVGLEYTFNNNYPVSAKPLEDEMALLFTRPFISPYETFLVLGGITLIDENGNGNADYAENIDLQIALNNLGGNPATDVVATLSSEDPYITVNQDQSLYNNILGECSENNLTYFNFDIAADCPDGHNAMFNLFVASSESEWELYFYLNLNAPDLQIGNVLILNDDNFNGILEPGETADLSIALINSGGSNTYSINAELTCDDSDVQINDGYTFIDIIPAYSTVNMYFNISLDENVEIGQILEFLIIISAEYDIQLIGNFIIILNQDFALEYDGIDDYVDCGNDPSLNGYWDGLTLEAWIKPSNLSNQQMILGKWASDTEEDHFALIIDENKLFIAVADGNTSETGVLSTINLEPGIWTHVAGTWESSTRLYKLYINGIMDELAVETQNGCGINTNSNANLKFGIQETGINQFDGIIDEIRIWNVTCTEEQIQYRMYSKLTGYEDGLIGYWMIDEGSGVVLHDYTINNNNGIINGGLWIEGFMLNGFAPPRDLTALLDSNTIFLEWLPPFVINELCGYNIYRDNEYHDFVQPDVNQYFDQALLYETYSYYITALYGESNESLPSNEIEIIISEFGHALDFNGVDNCVFIPNNPSLQITNEITLESWIKFKVGGTWNPRIISKGGDGAGYELLTMDTGASRVIRFMSQPIDFESSTILQADEFYHVAVTYDGQEACLYINGLLDNAEPATGSIPVSDLNVFIGQKSNWAWDKFKGIIDEVRIWNCSRSQNEIRNNMNLELSGNEENLVGYWKFDEGCGNLVFDLTEYGNNGIIYGISEWIQINKLAIPDLVTEIVDFIPVINNFWTCEEGDINLEFSYDPEVLDFNDIIIENTQLQDWDVELDQDEGLISIYASSMDLLYTETDTLLIFSFDPLVTDMETLFLFDSAYFGDELIRTRSGRIHLGEVEISEDILPVYCFDLRQNYPNPFIPAGAGRSPATTIRYQLAENSKISLKVYNIKGQLVRTLLNEIKPAGEHSIVWNGNDQANRSVPSGVYLYRLKTKDDSEIKKMILLK